MPAVYGDLFKFLQFFPFFKRELELQRMSFYIPISTNTTPTYVAFFKCTILKLQKNFQLPTYCSFGNLADTYHKEPSLDSKERACVFSRLAIDKKFYC